MPLTLEEEDRIDQLVLGVHDLFNNPHAYASDHELYVRARMGGLGSNHELYGLQSAMKNVRSIPGFDNASDQTVSEVRRYITTTLYSKIQNVRSYRIQPPLGQLDNAMIHIGLEPHGRA